MMGDDKPMSEDAELIAELQRTLRSDSMSESLPAAESVGAASGSDSVREEGHVPLIPLASEAAFAIADRVLGLSGVELTPSAIAPDISERRDLVLVVNGRTVPVPSDGRVLGRKPDSVGIMIRHPEISRNHALVTRAIDGLAVADLGSSNGTVVVRNQKRLTVGPNAVTLANGDQLMTRTDVLIAEVVAADSLASPS